MNTKGTASHADDIATTYSSRGYTIYDQLFKPDLVAPGNLVLSTINPNSCLATSFPRYVTSNGQYMYLSASGMAVPRVSGVVALMLQANPSLNPNLVKAILNLTAVKMVNAHLFEQGNGFLNARTAIDMAEAIDAQTHSLGSSVIPYWNLPGSSETVWAGGAFAFKNRLLYSTLVDSTAGLWGDGIIWSDSRSVIWSDSSMGDE